MDTLTSWVYILSISGGIVWVVVQKYRLDKWKENNQ